MRLKCKNCGACLLPKWYGGKRYFECDLCDLRYDIIDGELQYFSEIDEAEIDNIITLTGIYNPIVGTTQNFYGIHGDDLRALVLDKENDEGG